MVLLLLPGMLDCLGLSADAVFAGFHRMAVSASKTKH